MHWQLEQIAPRRGFMTHGFTQECPRCDVQVTRWPAFRQWSPERLRQAFEGRLLNVGGGCQLSFDNYLAYSADSR